MWRGLHYIHNKSNDTTASINTIKQVEFGTNDVPGLKKTYVLIFLIFDYIGCNPGIRSILCSTDVTKGFCASSRLGGEGSGGERSVAERVVWERRAPAPASAHGARPASFYAFAHQIHRSNAVFYLL